MRAPVRSLLVAGAFVAALPLAPGPGAAAAVPAPEVTGRSAMQLGVTHTQHSADRWNDGPSVARARALLSARPMYQNQHLMGWGAENPEPRPGAHDWASLDQRIDLIRATGGTPVLTLCCAPDWMKGGPAGTTDWTRLEAAPHRAHYADFAALAARAAARYPDIRHFQVWNELKGFYDPGRNQWDIEAYTELYNQVVAAVRRVRPDARFGGPYVVIDSWSDRAVMSHPSAVGGPWGTIDQRALDAIGYWLAHADDPDFLAIDLTTATRDAGHTGDPFASNAKITAVMDWIRARTDLPVWMSEFYAHPDDDPNGANPRNAALLTSAAATMTRAGVDVALQWGPQADRASCIGGCLWTDTRTPGGGQPTPLHRSLETLRATFPPGTDLLRNRSDDGRVTELRSGRHTLLVNHRGSATTVDLGITRVTLDPWETRVLPK